MTSVTIKMCRRCGEEKPLADYHRKKSAPDGCQPYCKACNSSVAAKMKRARVEANPNVREKYREYAAASYAANRAERLAYSAAWRAANPEQIKASQKRYWVENRDARLAGLKRYRDSNPVKRAAEFERWRKANPELEKARMARRRARRVSVPCVNFTPGQMTARFAFFGFRCWMCSAPATQADHVKPISRGGSHMLANLRPSCASCNARKRDRWFGANQLHRFTN